MAPRNPVAERLPRELYVEVTNRCNSRCQTCIRTFELLEPLRDLRLAEFQAIVDQFPVLERVVLHGRINTPMQWCCSIPTPSCSMRTGSVP
jgi:MoaA/NifB/PqqE/SkfB family radical SAM enzyme